MVTKLNSDKLRKTGISQAKKAVAGLKRNPLVLVLDNVLDTYNIGSFFRLADALAVEKIYLCGPVVTPPNIKIHRASIGTWKFVPWQHFDSTLDCIKQLKKEGYHIVSIEQSPKSIDYRRAKYKFPLALVLGSESKGISPQVISLSDQIVEIPLFGINISLNVLVAASVVSYHIVANFPKSK